MHTDGKRLSSPDSNCIRTAIASQRSLIQPLQIVTVDWNGIGRVAGIAESLEGKRFKEVFLNSVVSQGAAETQSFVKFLNKVNGLPIGFLRLHFQNIQSAGNADAAIQSRLALGIELHHVGQTNGVGCSVVHTAKSRQGMGQRMSGSEILLKSNS